MDKKILLVLLAFSLIFLTYGCSQSKESEYHEFFPEEKRFHIGFKTEESMIGAQVFFDEGGLRHLLHEDTASPLFGMEEIFSEKEVVSRFHEFEFKNLPHKGGSSIIYNAMQAIRKTNPVEAKIQDNKKIHRYEGEEMNFEFVFDKKKSTPLEIKGTFSGKEFNINFTASA